MFFLVFLYQVVCFYVILPKVRQTNQTKPTLNLHLTYMVEVIISRFIDHEHYQYFSSHSSLFYF